MRFLLVILALLVCHSLFAQSADDFNLVDQILSGEQEQTYAPPAIQKKDQNELQLTSSFLFTVYGNLISSQDGSRCGFYPTCSGYCRQAISKHGVLKGTIQGLDRLTRCNGLTPAKYTFDPERKKLIDHVH